MGTSKMKLGKKYTVIGTPEFMAPVRGARAKSFVTTNFQNVRKCMKRKDTTKALIYMRSG